MLIINTFIIQYIIDIAASHYTQPTTHAENYPYLTFS